MKCVTVLLAALACAAAPVPSAPPVEKLVRALGSSEKSERDAAERELRTRADAPPWLRRAARTGDKDTVRRALALLEPHDRKRVAGARAALDACFRDRSIDTFIEWYHLWQPDKKEELWEVGPRFGHAAVDLFGKHFKRDGTNPLEDAMLNLFKPAQKHTFHDGPLPDDIPGSIVMARGDSIRHVHGAKAFAFACLTGDARHETSVLGYTLTLGDCDSLFAQAAVIFSCGTWPGQWERSGQRQWPMNASDSVLIFRDHFRVQVAHLHNVILLVDGDITVDSVAQLRNCIIRATGDIHLPKGREVKNCTIEPRAKNATAPYRFFELSDVGLSVADDEEGMVVRTTKPNTPFGNAGLERGDLIRGIDGAPAGHSGQFRAAVRRALVRQGDALVTVVRGDKQFDVPVFFPLPK